MIKTFPSDGDGSPDSVDPAVPSVRQASDEQIKKKDDLLGLLKQVDPVDLTIEGDHCTPARKKLGEAKIYDDPRYHIEGVSQLLGRYATGREGRGLVLSYVRKKDIKRITDKLKIEMDTNLPEGQTQPCSNLPLKWSFLTKHKHSSGEIVSLGHIGCNLYI